MVNPQLLAYVREQHAAGLSQVEIIEQAHKAGWSDEDIAAAIEASQSNAPWAQGASSTAQPTNYKVPSYASTQRDASAKGIIGLVMRMGFAKTEQQANIVLIVFIMIISGTAAYLVWPKSTVPPVPPGSIVVPGPLPPQSQ